MAKATRSAASSSSSASSVVNRRACRVADVQDPDHPAGGHQRDAQHGLDALLPQDGVRHRRLVDAIQHNGSPFGCDSPGETHAQRDPDALVHLLLDAPGRSGHELLRAFLEQQDGRRVRVEHAPDPIEQLDQQVLDIQPPEGGVRDRLYVAEVLVGAIAIHCSEPNDLA